MNTGLYALAVAGLASLLSVSAGCDLLVTQQQPPSNSVVQKAVSEMYARAGVANEATSAKVLGKHYRPAQDAWKVVACVDFGIDETGAGRDCNDSFELYRMDSGAWMLNGTVNGAYRWLELPKSELKASTNAGS